MRTLIHLPLCPFARKVRMVLDEKGLNFALRAEPVWERRVDFLALNPACEVPVLVEQDGQVIADSTAICEYLEEVQLDPPLIGVSPPSRAETRRLVAWFDLKFYREVTRNLVDEKVTKRQQGRGAPNSAAVRAGYANIGIHLDYIRYLSERRRWLAGDLFSLADIAAAAQVSCLDFMGDVAWERYPEAKDWYARVKSRPSFRPILADHVPGIQPAAHYADLDF